ncbi:hypothetical protein CCP2SC5_880002 [Azospirillaceae bacterium]
MDWNLAKEIGEGVAVAGFVGLGVFNRLRQSRLEKQFRLSPNPTRCAEHAEAINEMRLDIKRIKDNLGII